MFTSSRSSCRPLVAAASVLVLLVALAVQLLLSGGPASADSGGSSKTVTTRTGVVTHGSIKTTRDTIGWLLRCDYSHSSNDDPIVHPGMAGMSHLHDFYGNSSTDASSTVSSMLGSSTVCGTAADTAAYWTPALSVGTRVVAPDQTSQQVYYRAKYAAGVRVEPTPTDLRVVVGNATATDVASNPALVGGTGGTGGIYWQCVGDDHQKYQVPPSCSGGGVLENVQFPSCWDGRLGARPAVTNDSEHLAYVRDDGRCPLGFGHALPQISLKVKYVIGIHGSGVRLASGSVVTAHADFWNTWRPAGLAYLVDRCITAGVSCGTNPVAPTGR